MRQAISTLASNDCVPFQVRMPDTWSDDANRRAPPAFISKSSLRETLVRAGQTVTLLWDQDGIRLTVPAVCLEAGGQGETVRVQLTHSGRVVRAIVVQAGSLRVVS